MNEPSANPYASPTADTSIPSSHPSTRLHPLWIWLGIAVVTSFFGTPADPISTLIALAYGLGCFCFGAILGSSIPAVLRVLPLIVWAVPAACLAMFFGHPYFIAGAIVYAAVSVAIGFWTCRSIHAGRLRLLASFCAGYVVGTTVGILGTIGGAVVATMLARRSLRMSAQASANEARPQGRVTA